MKFYIVKPKIKKNETDMSKKTSKTIDEKKRKTIVENNNNGGAEQVDKNALNEEQQNQDISAEEVMAEMEEAAQSSEITSELEKKFEELNFKAFLPNLIITVNGLLKKNRNSFVLQMKIF
jgi:hypothetical protein